MEVGIFTKKKKIYYKSRFLRRNDLNEHPWRPALKFKKLLGLFLKKKKKTRAGYQSLNGTILFVEIGIYSVNTGLR